MILNRFLINFFFVIFSHMFVTFAKRGLLSKNVWDFINGLILGSGKQSLIYKTCKWKITSNFFFSPYECDQCDKKFGRCLRIDKWKWFAIIITLRTFYISARGGQLMVHRRTHTGDKVVSFFIKIFQCDYLKLQ